MTDFWVDYKQLQVEAEALSTIELLKNLIHLENELLINRDQFLIYSLKRYKSNENRMFIDNYYDMVIRSNVMKEELCKRWAD